MAVARDLCFAASAVAGGESVHCTGPLIARWLGCKALNLFTHSNMSSLLSSVMLQFNSSFARRKEKRR